MGNKPWEEKVTEDNSEKLTRQSASNDMVSTPILTILLRLLSAFSFLCCMLQMVGEMKKKLPQPFMEAQKQRKQKLAIRKHRLFLILPKQQRMQRLHLAVILWKYSLVKVLRRLLPEQESQLRNCMN